MPTPIEYWNLAGAVIFSIGSGGTIVWGLSSWLGKVWASRILETDRLKYSQELERLRSDLDKAIHVHRVQFETEFRVLSDIWAKLSALRSAMGELRPRMDIVDLDEDREERFTRRQKKFGEAFSAYIRAVDEQSPFYPEEIFQELSTALQIARRESISVSIEQERNADWFKDGATNYQALLSSADIVSVLIRKRLKDLQVRP